MMRPTVKVSSFFLPDPPPCSYRLTHFTRRAHTPMAMRLHLATACILFAIIVTFPNASRANCCRATIFYGGGVLSSTPCGTEHARRTKWIRHTLTMYTTTVFFVGTACVPCSVLPFSYGACLVTRRRESTSRCSPPSLDESNTEATTAAGGPAPRKKKR